jgi:hypothetical protein
MMRKEVSFADDRLLITSMLFADIYSYAFSQMRVLSLPIPQVLALTAVILPLFTGISSQFAYRLLRTYNSNPRLLLYLFVIFAFQLIYETIIATWSVNYIVPNCGLEDQWKRLYTNKDADAIRRIQDRFDCCGFNTAVDRAWPFPHGRPQDGFGADQCKRTYGRDRPCVGPWRQAEQINAGVFFTVATVLFLAKVCKVIHRHLLIVSRYTAQRCHI